MVSKASVDHNTFVPTKMKSLQMASINQMVNLGICSLELLKVPFTWKEDDPSARTGL